MSNAVAAHLSRAQRLKGPIQAALAKKLLHETSPVCDMYDLDALRGRFSEIQSALPNWNHAVAIKTNPIAGVLLEAKKAGLGAEAASMGELQHALNIGFNPEKIVYDSPVKTMYDLERAIKAGVHINLDNLQEITKVNELLNGKCKGIDIDGRIGVRVNPEVGAGKIAMSSTAGRSSKFGLMMRGEFESEVLKIFKNNPWLQGLHQHIGSQGISLEQLVLGVERLVEFANKVNDQAGFKQVKSIDVGGGIPTDYQSDDEKVRYVEYANLLKSRVPNATEFNLISEFGRSLFTKYAFSISRVETVKDWGDRITVLTHFGSNQFLREVYLPDVWFHRMSIVDSSGNPKSDQFIEQDIGGPLCFQGDYLAKGRELPKIADGDFLIMHDTGGYTYALYSRFNSIQAPAIYGYEKVQDGYRFLQFKERETLEETLAFWGTHKPHEV